MIAKLQKWGNSSAVRIPATIVQQLGAKAGGPLRLEVKSGALVIKVMKRKKPAKHARTKEPALKDLLRGMTPDNRHPLVDVGPDVGREIVE